MEMFTGKVKRGRVDVPGDELPEGAEVIVLIPGDEASFTLTDSERAQLTEAIDQLRRGEGVDGWQLLQELQS